MTTDQVATTAKRSNQWFKPLLIDDFLKEKTPETEWLVEGLIPKGDIAALTAPAATYKTFLAVDIAIQVSQGKPLFSHFKTKQKNVLYIDEENNKNTFQQRFKLQTTEEQLPIHISSLADFRLEEDRASAVIKYCQEHDIGLVILDSLIRMHSLDENSAKEMSRVYDVLKPFKKLGITVIYLHHHRKTSGTGYSSERLRGSSEILASLDCHLMIERCKDSLTINQCKLRAQIEHKPFKVDIQEEKGKNIKFVFSGMAKESLTKVDEAKQAVKELLGNSNQQLNKTGIIDSIKEQYDIGETNTKNAIRDMIESGDISISRGANNTHFCELTQEPN